MLRLVRRLTRLRQKLPHVKTGEHWFFNEARYTHQGLLLFARYFPNTPAYTLIALNFSGTERSVPFWFPVGGNYREELHGDATAGLNLTNVRAYQETWLTIPSNYGRIFSHV